ncbi:uncharacterized protein TNCV_2538701 [Trichonephila clavipes]|nr:uncharacterized protein TNCV_2538701 [Trichonephila clavipes]
MPSVSPIAITVQRAFQWAPQWICEHSNFVYLELRNPHEVLESQADTPKMNDFCTISRRKVYGAFVFGEPTASGSAYLDTLQLLLFPHLKESKPDEFIWKQCGAPPQWYLSVRVWVNITVLDQGSASTPIQLVSHDIHVHPI